MIKKFISTLFLFCALLTCAGAAESIFPVRRTGMDGVTRAGYLDENGTEILPFVYTQASEFADCGLASVENDNWQTAVIDRTGNVVIPYAPSPLSVDFSENSVAYRYTECSIYYTLEGECIGSYPYAEGFFSDGRLLCKNKNTGLYRYVKESGSPAFVGEFAKAGAFTDGMALVCLANHTYQVIDTGGQVLYTLPGGMTPTSLDIFYQDILVVSNGTGQALYSLSQGKCLTQFQFSSVSMFQNGAAMAKENGLWGIINTSGRWLTPPSYYYLSYMGDGLYAARGADGSVAAVDANGNVSYRTTSYVGGFNELHYGLSWHGMADGGLIFFRKNGGYFASLPNAENPTLLSENVVRVTQDGTIRYINLWNGNILFEQPKQFQLGGGITARTVHYERFLGYQADGSEHGWNVDFPEISGLPDTQVQKTINNAIREFFLKGQSVSAEYEALEGGYGVSLEGCVLVVWANCVSGRGKGAAVWNNNLAFDIRTGKRYEIRDLFVNRSVNTDLLRSLLPASNELYLYSYPRMSREGVTYFLNVYESDTRRAHTESFLLPFSQMAEYIDRQSACYIALQTEVTQQAGTQAASFSDVPATHWAANYIQTVTSRGLMTGGPDGRFRPDDQITVAEVCATITRGLQLPVPEQTVNGLDAGLWYADAVSAVYSAGLLPDLSHFLPSAAMTRENAMQLFANILIQNGAAVPNMATVTQVLSGFQDSAAFAGNRRTAAVLCLQQGLVEGNAAGLLRPKDAFTRAEFAKLLVTVLL